MYGRVSLEGKVLDWFMSFKRLKFNKPWDWHPKKIKNVIFEQPLLSMCLIRSWGSSKYTQLPHCADFMTVCWSCSQNVCSFFDSFDLYACQTHKGWSEGRVKSWRGSDAINYVALNSIFWYQASGIIQREENIIFMRTINMFSNLLSNGWRKSRKL